MSINDNSHVFKPMSDITDKKLNLTLPEIVFIDDHITLMIHAKEWEGMIPLKPVLSSSLIVAPIDMVDKIGKAFIEAVEKGNSTILVSEAELYMLRELALSKADYFGHKVGLSLKKKVLYTLHSKDIEQKDFLEKLLKDIDLGDNK
jgi:hypothetical protein